MNSLFSKKEYIILALGLLLIAGIIAKLIFFQSERKNEEPLIGLILTGSKTEGGWNEAHYQGMVKACSNLPVRLKVVENIAEGTKDCYPVIDSLVKSGAKVIFLAGYGFGSDLEGYSLKYPEVNFYQTDAAKTGNNVAAYFARIYQARYLSGIIAGSKTASGRIGYIAAEKNPEVIRGINAFALGVRLVNPKAVVYVNWTGKWEDEVRERECADDLIKNKQIDVLTYHQNKTYVIDEAEKNNILSIGYHFDDSRRYSQKYLTAAVWNFADVYQKKIKDFLAGKKFVAENYWESINDNAVGLAPYSSLVDKETREKVKSVQEKFKSGWDVFRGPIYDNKGVLRVQADETISDEYLLNKFDWLVDGVAESQMKEKE